MNRPTFNWLFENSVAFNRFLVRQFNERLGTIHRAGRIRPHARCDRAARAQHRLAVQSGALSRWRAASRNQPGGDRAAVGLSRPVTNKSLQILEAKGLLLVERNGLTVRNLEGAAGFRRLTNPRSRLCARRAKYRVAKRASENDNCNADDTGAPSGRQPGTHTEQSRVPSVKSELAQGLFCCDLRYKENSRAWPPKDGRNDTHDQRAVKCKGRTATWRYKPPPRRIHFRSS